MAIDPPRFEYESQDAATSPSSRSQNLSTSETTHFELRPISRHSRYMRVNDEPIRPMINIDIDPTTGLLSSDDERYHDILYVRQQETEESRRVLSSHVLDMIEAEMGSAYVETIYEEDQENSEPSNINDERYEEVEEVILEQNEDGETHMMVILPSETETDRDELEIEYQSNLRQHWLRMDDHAWASGLDVPDEMPSPNTMNQLEFCPFNQDLTVEGYSAMRPHRVRRIACVPPILLRAEQSMRKTHLLTPNGNWVERDSINADTVDEQTQEALYYVWSSLDEQQDPENFAPTQDLILGR